MPLIAVLVLAAPVVAVGASVAVASAGAMLVADVVGVTLERLPLPLRPDAGYVAA